MKLIEALKHLQQVSPRAFPFGVSLACGFTPLHLQTFLAAHLQQRLGPVRRVVVETGVYGDAIGNVERLRQTPADVCVVALEWADCDPRLGLRQPGGWNPRDLPDVLKTVDAQAVRLEHAIEETSRSRAVVVSLPTLPLPPVSYLPGHQLGSFEADLRATIAGTAARLACLPWVRLLNPQRLDWLSPLERRLDLTSELSAGFPYEVAHADILAELVAQLVLPPSPKKGLITDLDNTLWKGILGEVGILGISWDLDQHSQMHGLYQQMLRSLAAAGVLIGVASKNDPSLVEEVFRRQELVRLRGCLFPVEVSWGPKSEAVGRILHSWNMGAESVVFIDDSPMERAEVKAAHPEMECLTFPAGREPAIYHLLIHLRDLFGKEALSAEDAIRRESLHQAGQARAGKDGEPTASVEDFLAQADAELVCDFVDGSPPARALELVNKTNQFNLNGRRYTEGEWLASLQRPGGFLLQVRYRDKYGPLGTIAILAGRAEQEAIHVDTWVMSCRAFSRRIEHGCLKAMFDHFGSAQVAFDFTLTSRNGPFQEFFAAFLGSIPENPFRISKSLFQEKCPPLYHRVEALSHG